jgi:hypothetical protein
MERAPCVGLGPKSVGSSATASDTQGRFGPGSAGPKKNSETFLHARMSQILHFPRVHIALISGVP